MAQVEFKKITKQYDDNIEAVKDVNIEINKGEFVFLVGNSGAGKSTLIKLLIREELPDSGEVLFNGENIFGIPQKELPNLRRKIGVVFQDFKVLNSHTVFENVAVALEVVDTPEKTIKEIVPNVLNMVGLQNKVNTFPFKLSGGEKQRLAIARALAHEPDILVADEPTGMIDPDATEEVIEILEKINALGTTILMATHNQDIVNKLKKRVIRLKNGQVVSDKSGGTYA
jgi:cell division transport system ATP-binding protein